MKELITILLKSPQPISRLYEATLMRIGGHRLTFREYVDYQLHTDQTLTADERRRFIGEDRKWRLHVRCNQKQWFMLHYKIPFTQFMLGSGLPIPKIHALYDKHSAHYLPGAVTLGTEAAAIEYLTNMAPFPIFIKPDDGQFGEGAVGIQEYYKETQELVYTNGDKEPVENFVKKINNQSKTFLFQELLRPGDTIANVCGQAISSLRVTIGRTAQGLEIISACWRIPAGKNMTDNFHHGESGNLLGGLDIKTGRVTQVYGRSGDKVGLVRRHPDTDYSFEGFMIPDWAQIIDILMTAGKTMSGLNIQNWDVALTDQGPVITEINVFGDMDIHQYANRQGFRSPKLEEVLAHSYQVYLNEFPWIIRKITPYLQKMDSLR